MMQSMSYPYVSALKRSLSGATDAELWFPEDALEYPSFGCVVHDSAAAENLDDLLMMVESVDADDAEESLKPGIGVGNFNEIPYFQQHEDCPLTPVQPYLERPTTPPTTKPSFNELPPIISPDLYMERDSETSFALNEAFQPPMRHHVPSLPTRRQQNQGVPSACEERSLLDNLAHSMRRSQASRREILQGSDTFDRHPSMYEIERLEHCHHRMWSFIALQQQCYP
jgi:hypothetical protein